MKHRIFPRSADNAYGYITKCICLVILSRLLSACLVTEQAVFGPADFVTIKGLEGVYSVEKETKSSEYPVTVRIEALGDGRYRTVFVGAKPGKKDKVESYDIGFVPLRNNFHLAVFTISGSKFQHNFYQLAAMGAGDIQTWDFPSNSENMENIVLKTSLSRHGLSINESGLMGMMDLITSGQHDVPSPKALKAFFSDLLGNAAQAADLEKSGWGPMKKLVKKKS